MYISIKRGSNYIATVFELFSLHIDSSRDVFWQEILVGNSP